MSIDEGISRADLVIQARVDWSDHRTPEGEIRRKACAACPDEGPCPTYTRAEKLLRDTAEQARKVGGMFIWDGS